MPIQPLPEGAQPLIPYLIVNKAAAAIEFYKLVFAADEVMRMAGPDGKSIMHAELRIAGCLIYLADENPEQGHLSPTTVGTTTVGLSLYCLDADKVFNRALDHGAEVVRPMMDAFWGDRYGVVVDPFGHQWSLMTRKEHLSPEEMVQRGNQSMR
ncbi:MAG: VOC family protein [Candidatus Eremiobacteraeota bacterium]|nr:VOC family protein [Candidatus Eremiobacteraeota bacterium]